MGSFRFFNVILLVLFVSHSAFAESDFSKEYECGDFEVYPKVETNVKSLGYPEALLKSKPVAIDSIGLDYFYTPAEAISKAGNEDTVILKAPEVLGSVPIYVTFESGERVEMIFANSKGSLRKYKSKELFSGGHLYIGLDVFHPTCGDEDEDGSMVAEIFWRKEIKQENQKAKKIYMRARCLEHEDSRLNELYFYYKKN